MHDCAKKVRLRWTVSHWIGTLELAGSTLCEHASFITRGGECGSAGRFLEAGVHVEFGGWGAHSASTALLKIRGGKVDQRGRI